MSDFFDNINRFLIKDFVSSAKRILENPNNLSEKIISYLNTHDLDLNNINTTNAKDINNDLTKKDNTNILKDENDYEYLYSRLCNIENTMAEIQEFLEKDN